MTRPGEDDRLREAEIRRSAALCLNDHQGRNHHVMRLTWQRDVAALLRLLDAARGEQQANGAAGTA